MTASRNIADLSQLIENASNGTVLTSDGSGGLSFAASSGGSSVTTYATPSDLPLSGNSSGDMAYVTSVNRLYVSTGSGWYSISLVNTNPSITSVQDASSGTTPFTLATDGTATVVTITASDPEDVPLTYSYSVTSGSLTNGGGTTATVSQGTGSNTNVFTITPSTNSLYAGSFTLTFSASDQINTATSAAVFSLTFSITNSEYTTALITTSGSTGGNATFTDGSSNSRTISVTGNSTNTSFSPYRHAGYSMYFDGSGDYIEMAANSSFQFDTNDFTVEFWYKHVANTSAMRFLGNNYQNGTWTTNRWTMGIISSKLMFQSNTMHGSSHTPSTTSIDDGDWHHCALAREGSNFRLFVDGTLEATYTNSGSLDGNNAYGFTIGARGTSAEQINGYLRDFRISNNARYTATFDAPTETFTSDSNTNFLAFSTPYLKDLSSNAHAITSVGNTHLQGVSPFTHSGYSASANGGSVRFDGSGDYLSATTTALGTGDWTVEYWVYHDNLSANRIHAAWGSYSPAFYYRVASDRFAFYSGGVNSISSVVPVAKQWYHIAWVHDDSANEIKAYVNGKLEDTNTSFTTNLSGTSLRVGNDTTSSYMLGNIADFRVTNTTVYTSDFTPPTQPLTNITGTNILVTGDEANIIDRSQSITDVKLNGTSITASTTQNKNRASSIEMNLSGDNDDYVEISDYEGIQFAANQDFTIECWIYSTVSGSGNIDRGAIFELGIYSDGIFVAPYGNTDTCYINGTNLGDFRSSLSANTWHHIALVRNGTSTNNVKLYVDGTQVLQGSNNSATPSSNTNGLKIGHANHNAGFDFQGYIDDFRVTKGVARYTSSFTPPSSALQG